MVTIFNRKQLMIDQSSMELIRVRSILEEANIPLAAKTVKSHSTAGQSYDARAGVPKNAPYSNDHIGFVYYIYVKKKDYADAYQRVYGVDSNVVN